MSKSRKISWILVQFLLSTTAFADLPSGINDQAIRQAAVQSFPEYLNLLTLPNDSIASVSDMQTNANQVEKLFQKRGFATKQFANNGKPLVLAELPSDPSKKTILFYIHFDGQPVIPAQWSQPSPWQPVLKKKGTDGKWQIIDMQELIKSDFDPELRVFGRSSSDDKDQRHIVHLAIISRRASDGTVRICGPNEIRLAVQKVCLTTSIGH